MSDNIGVSLRFRRHMCTNMTDSSWTIGDSECSCRMCACDEVGSCCGEECGTPYCPYCGDSVDQPYCYACKGETCGCGVFIAKGANVYYTGDVHAEWRNGELYHYEGEGHPHIDSESYCLGECAELFVGVTTIPQAIEAIVTHISNVDFGDAVSEDPTGIEV